MDGFFIASLESMGQQWQSLSHSQRRSANELFFVNSGYIIRNCNFNSIRLNKNDIHLSLSHQFTSISSISSDIKGFYIRFNDSFLEQVYLKENIGKELEFINSFLFQYPLRLNKEVAGRVESNLNTLLALNQEPVIDHTLTYVYMLAIIYEIKKIMVEIQLDFYPSKAFLITKKYNDLLATHIEKERSVEFYAKKLDLSPNHLNKSVKSVTGHTAISLLNEMTVMEAKMRLKYTNLPVSEIAFQLGFEDQSYFSRYFKKATGHSPIDYRKMEK